MFARTVSPRSIPGLAMLSTLLLCLIYSPVSAEDGTQKWVFNTGGYIYSSPAIGADGTIYIGSGLNSFTGLGSDGLYAVNPDGTRKWLFETSGAPAFSSPAIDATGVIYIGTDDGRLYAVYEDGAQKWALQADGAIRTPAISHDGVIYVSSVVYGSTTTSVLYAINSDGTIKWQFEEPQVLNSPVAVGSDGSVYAGSQGGKLYAFNPDGSQKWVFDAGVNQPVSSPAIGVDGTIYILWGSFSGYLGAINPDDGALKWQSSRIEGDNDFSPCIGPDGTIYAGTELSSTGFNAGYLYAFNPDGTLKWSTSTAGIRSTPVLGDDGSLYVGSYTRCLNINCPNPYAIVAFNSDGIERWSLDAGGLVDSSPAIGLDGTLYIGSYDGNLYAINTASRGLASSFWPMFGRDLRHSSSVPVVLWHDWFAVDARETPMVGDFNGDGMTDIITFTRDNPLAVGDVYVALSEGDHFGPNTFWNDWFAVSPDEMVVIGDFNGDGMDDLATWLGNSSRQVYVATSYGSGMNDSEEWAESVGEDPSDVLTSGDVDGDGKDDLIMFSRTAGRVWVARSTGNGFSSPEVWHNWFAVSTYERPDVGDVDGDGRTDIITFCTDSPTARGDVYVALSEGDRFEDKENSQKWHDWFAVDPAQTVRIADLDGDGRDDILNFMPPSYGQVYAVYSEGSYLSDNVLWTQDFFPSDAAVYFAGDVDGNGKDDLIGFYQAEGKVYLLLTP
jgi:outer membrane protein assembly factor BamB